MSTSSYQTHTFVTTPRPNYICLPAVSSGFDHQCMFYPICSCFVKVCRPATAGIWLQHHLTEMWIKKWHPDLPKIAVWGPLRLPSTLETLCKCPANSALTFNGPSMLHSDINNRLPKISHKRFYFNPMAKSLRNVELTEASLQKITRKCWHF